MGHEINVWTILVGKSWEDKLEDYDWKRKNDIKMDTGQTGCGCKLGICGNGSKSWELGKGKLVPVF